MTYECLLGDDLQDVEDQLHDHRTLTQLTGSTVDDGDQGAVQVTQVLRQQRLTVTSCQVAHLLGGRLGETEQPGNHFLSENFNNKHLHRCGHEKMKTNYTSAFILTPGSPSSTTEDQVSDIKLSVCFSTRSCPPKSNSQPQVPQRPPAPLLPPCGPVPGQSPA